MSALTAPVPGRITSPFSLTRKHPVTGVTQPHLGTDLQADVGEPVRAITAGIVRAVHTGSYWGDSRRGLHPGRTGNGMDIWYPGIGALSYYGHLESVTAHVGQTVNAGQIVAHAGRTGVVSGPHLHLEIHVDGHAVDPTPWLAARGLTLGTTPTEEPMSTPLDVIAAAVTPGTAGVKAAGPLYEEAHTAAAAAAAIADTLLPGAEGVRHAGPVYSVLDRIAAAVERILAHLEKADAA